MMSVVDCGRVGLCGGHEAQPVARVRKYGEYTTAVFTQQRRGGGGGGGGFVKSKKKGGAGGGGV